MNRMEKVKRGLEHCTQHDDGQDKFGGVGKCNGCPYYGYDCTGEMKMDALALLKEQQERIKTLAIRNIVPNYLVREIEFVKTDMANRLASKLVAEGFVEFFSEENKYEPIADVTEIEARICVVKPTQK